MKKHFATGCIAAVALAWSLGMTGCCCQRKGLVLRGDWSFELNRVPHMRSNGPTYSGDSCVEPCDDFSCTSDSCSDGSCLSCREGGRSGRARGAGGEYYESMPRSGGGGGAGGYGGEPHMPAPPQPTPAAQSRFHPVPTRPVFEPQHGVATMPAEYDVNGNGAATSSRRAVEQRSPATRPTDVPPVPRSNRVATRAAQLRANERERYEEERSQEVRNEAVRYEEEVVQAAAIEEYAVSHEPSADDAEPEPAPTSNWRVKVRRS